MYANLEILVDTEMRRAKDKTSVTTIKWQADSEGAYSYVSIIDKYGATRDFIFKDGSWILAGSWSGGVSAGQDRLIRELILE